MAHKPRSRKYVLIGCSVAALCMIVLIAYTGMRVHQAYLELECQDNLTTVSRAIASKTDAETFPGEDELPQLVGREKLICPACEKPYVYSPRMPAGEPIMINSPARHIIMWCPEPCHRGRRVCLVNDLGTWVYADEEINWQHQRPRAP